MKNKSCRVFANAKINLHLEVVGRRSDGYHNISSVMQSVDLRDEIEITLTDTGKIQVFTENQVIEGENLVFLAAKRFFEAAGENCGAEIRLVKNIPISAGLGGGSSDGAAVLTALNGMFGSPLSKEQISNIALSLGADVPFCLEGGTKKCEGLGEILSDINPSQEFYVILIKHHKKQSTGYMYSLIDEKICENSVTDKVVSALEQGNFEALRKYAVNNFLSVSADCEEQKEICNTLYGAGAVLSGLSGSGPTVFGLFEKTPGAEFFEELKKKYKEVYLCKTL